VSVIDFAAARRKQKQDMLTNMANRARLARERQALVERITPNLGKLSIVQLRLLAEQLGGAEVKEVDG